MSERRPDVKIAVMGPTGTGKSSLIKLITDDENIIIGHDVESETSEIGLSQFFESDGRCITFIDTPGFDDSREGVTDAIILQRIAAYLETEYKDGEPTLNGVIYLHRITDTRMGGTAVRNLKMFHKLCGPSAIKNVTVVTTRWDTLDEKEGAPREEELMTNPNFFKPLVDAGARFHRHDGTSESARKVMLQMIDNKPIALQIQLELAKGMQLNDTGAGSELTSEMNELLEKHREELQNLRKEMEDAVTARDDELSTELKEERERLELEVEKLSADKQRLGEEFDTVRSGAQTGMETAEFHREEMRRSFLEDQEDTSDTPEIVPLAHPQPEVEAGHVEGQEEDKEEGPGFESDIVHDMDGFSPEQEPPESMDEAHRKLAELTHEVSCAAESKREADDKFEELSKEMCRASVAKFAEDRQFQDSMKRLLDAALKALAEQKDTSAKSEKYKTKLLGKYKSLKIRYEQERQLRSESGKNERELETKVEGKEDEINKLRSELSREKSEKATCEKLLEEKKEEISNLRLELSAEASRRIGCEQRAEQERTELMAQFELQRRAILSEMEQQKAAYEGVFEIFDVLEKVEGARMDLERQLMQTKREKELSDRRWQQLLEQENNRAVETTAHAELMFRELFDLTSRMESRVDDTSKPPDVMIAIMGPPGSGKSSLMQSITGDTSTEDNHGFESETLGIRMGHIFEPSGRRVTLVEVPAFYDSRDEFSESESLKSLAAFLDVEFEHEGRLTGVIYLHRMTDEGVDEVSARNLQMFEKLCGPDVFQNVVIVTTQLQKDGETEVVDWEGELGRHDNLKPLINAGAQLFLHDGTPESAALLTEFFIGKEPITLKIQHELAEGTKLDETAVGSELAAHMAELIDRSKRQAVDLQQQLEEGALQDEVEKLKLEGTWKELELMTGKIETEKKCLSDGLESVKEQALARYKFEDNRLATLAILQKVEKEVHALRMSYQGLAHSLEEAAYNMQTADFWSQRQVDEEKEKTIIDKTESVEKFDDLIRQMLQIGLDPPVNDAGPIIAIMGPTGTGKSSFIRQLTGDKSVKIGHSVESETADIGQYKYLEDSGRYVTLIDTPGFDDSRDGTTDVSILKMIASFFHSQFQDGKRLSGIIYLHRITDNRIGGVNSRFMKMLRKFCGSHALKNVAIVTTRWDGIKSEGEGIMREKQLANNEKFVKPFIDANARFLRHTGSFGSARRIVAQLLGNDPIDLEIQIELSHGATLESTGAGSELSAEMTKLIKKHEDEMNKLKEEMHEAIALKDETWKKELEQERASLARMIADLVMAVNQLGDDLNLVRTDLPDEKVERLGQQHLTVVSNLQNVRTAIGENAKADD